MKVVIVGIGGGGSHLAYFLSKHVKELVLIDHDKVEAKNLDRQLFSIQDIGKFKVDAMKKFLSKYSPKCEVKAIRREIRSNLDLADFHPEKYIAIAETDSIHSKKIISQYFKYAISGGCEADYFEINDVVDRYDSTWELGTGYETTQTFESNIAASAYIFSLLKRKVKIGKIEVRLNTGGAIWEIKQR